MRQQSERRSTSNVKDGIGFRRRRECLGLSIETVARRASVRSDFLVALESGTLKADIPLPTWINLVWATTEPWPEARQRASEFWTDQGARVGWVGGGLGVAEELVARVIAGPGAT